MRTVRERNARSAEEKSTKRERERESISSLCARARTFFPLSLPVEQADLENSRAARKSPHPTRELYTRLP